MLSAAERSKKSVINPNKKVFPVLDEKEVASYPTSNISYADNSEDGYTGAMYFLILKAGNQPIVHLRSFACLVMLANPANPGRNFVDKAHVSACTYNGTYYKFLNHSLPKARKERSAGLSASQIYLALKDGLSRWRYKPAVVKNVEKFFQQFMKKNPDAKPDETDIFAGFLPEFIAELPKNAELQNIERSIHKDKLIDKGILTGNFIQPKRLKSKKKYIASSTQEIKINPVSQQSDLHRLASLATEKRDVDMVQSSSSSTTTPSTVITTTTRSLESSSLSIYQTINLFSLAASHKKAVRKYPIQPKPIKPPVSENTAKRKSIMQGPTSLGHSDRSLFAKRQKLDVNGLTALTPSATEEQKSSSFPHKTRKT